MSHHYPKPGDQAPDFELPAVGDKSIKLSEYRGEKNVILSIEMEQVPTSTRLSSISASMSMFPSVRAARRPVDEPIAPMID